MTSATAVSFMQVPPPQMPRARTRTVDFDDDDDGDGSYHRDAVLLPEGFNRRDVLTVTEDMPLSAARTLFGQHGASAFPVVGDRGEIHGVVTLADVYSQNDATVGDVMSHFALILRAGAPLHQAAALMAYEGLHHVVLVGDGGIVVGVVTATDVARAFARDAGYHI